MSGEEEQHTEFELVHEAELRHTGTLTTRKTTAIAAGFVASLLLLAVGAWAALNQEPTAVPMVVPPAGVAGGLGTGADAQVAEPPRRDEGEPFFQPAPPDFTFVVQTDAPQVLLARVSDPRRLATGEVTWAGPPLEGADVRMRTDVDTDAVPAGLLELRGQGFVARDARGRTCDGRLGELSLLRLVNRAQLAYRLYEVDEGHEPDITEEEFEFLKGPGHTPPSARLDDPSFYWDRLGVTFLVARLESAEECTEPRWGHAPGNAPSHFSEIATHEFDAQATRSFRAHPDYAAQQAMYDSRYESLVQEAEENAEYGEEFIEWPEGPWESGFFATRVFATEDGRRLLVASGDQTDECSDGGPSRLLLLFDITAAGQLVFRDKILALPHYGYQAFVERGGVLHYLTEWSLIEVDDFVIVVGFGDGTELNSGCW